MSNKEIIIPNYIKLTFNSLGNDKYFPFLWVLFFNYSSIFDLSVTWMIAASPKFIKAEEKITPRSQVVTFLSNPRCKILNLFGFWTKINNIAMEVIFCSIKFKFSPRVRYKFNDFIYGLCESENMRMDFPETIYVPYLWTNSISISRFHNQFVHNLSR